MCRGALYWALSLPKLPPLSSVGGSLSNVWLKTLVIWESKRVLTRSEILVVLEMPKSTFQRGRLRMNPRPVRLSRNRSGVRKFPETAAALLKAFNFVCVPGVGLPKLLTDDPYWVLLIGR